MIDYWVWDNLLDINKIKEINSFIENNFNSIEDPKAWGKSHDGKRLKYTDTKIITWEKVKHLLQEVEDKCLWTARKEFGYNVYSLNNLDQIFDNTYKEGGEYGWHIDSSRSNLYDVKLTLLVNTSEDPYEGGQFKIFNNGEYEVKELNKSGNAILMKSNLNHKVASVTKGVRRSIALFFYGPKFI